MNVNQSLSQIEWARGDGETPDWLLLEEVAGVTPKSLA